MIRSASATAIQATQDEVVRALRAQNLKVSTGDRADQATALVSPAGRGQRAVEVRVLPAQEAAARAAVATLPAVSSGGVKVQVTPCANLWVSHFESCEG